MNLLLDTHIILWAVTDDDRLSKKARDMILDPDNTVYYSAVSVWEILLKHDSPACNIDCTASEFVQDCREAGYYPLNLTEKHILTVDTLKRNEGEKEHKEPFDRLLIAQAKAENFSFLTHDKLIPGYNEKCIISV